MPFFRPIDFLSLDLSRVYHFDLRIDDAIVLAIFANPYIAIFRPIGANSIFGHFYFLSLDLRRIYNFDPKIYDPIVFTVVTM